LRVLDALHIRETGVEPEEGEDGDAPQDETATDVPAAAAQKPSKLQIVWSSDWMKSALVIDGLCHALFDFIAHGGHNINEFPPPNELWTQGDRKLTMELMQKLF
jgi:hypothetical protein